MDHEGVPCSSKIYDWPLNLARELFSLHQRKNVKVIMKLEVSKRFIFRPTLFIVMIQQVLWWEKQKSFSCCKSQGTMTRKCCFNNLFILGNHYCSQEERSKERGENKTCKKNLNFPFLGIFKKNQHIHFLVHGHSSWSTFNLLLMKGPKSLKFWISHEPWKCDHGKRLFDIMGRSLNAFFLYKKL